MILTFFASTLGRCIGSLFQYDDYDLATCQSQLRWTFVSLKLEEKKKKIEQLVNMSTENDLVTLSDQFVNFELAFDIKNIDKMISLKNLKFIMFQFHTNSSPVEWILLLRISFSMKSSELKKKLLWFCVLHTTQSYQ